MFGIEKDIPVIACVGRLIDWKGHNYLLDTIDLLKRKNNLHIKLLIVGEGPNKDELTDKVFNLGLTNDVLFVGYLKDAMDIMASSDIVVVPSKNEPFGRVVIEAMSVGAPVIATEGGGIPEIIQDGTNGLLVHYGDVEELSKSIKRVIEDEKLRDKIIYEAKRCVNKYYIQEKYNEELSSIFQKYLIS